MLSFIVANSEVHNELIVPAPFFGIAALVILLLLTLVVFSYRDVSHRREVVSHEEAENTADTAETAKKASKAKK